MKTLSCFVTKFTSLIVSVLLSRESLVTLVLCLGGLGAGCGRQLAPRPDRSRQDQGSNADHEIFDIVLSDMIGNKEFNPAVGGRSIKKSQVVLEAATYGGVSDHFLSHLSNDPTKAIPSEIRVDLLRRNPKGERYSLASYHPSNANILISDLSRVDLDLGFAEVFPDARGYVQPYLPGYSRDGQSALFLFGFGPTSHGAVGYYLLNRESGRWEIVWSIFGYFN
ncbi:MAG: hypothetical protein ACHRXM_31060 [Isosphaerales bacterium]